MTVNVLGTPYTIAIKQYADDPYFEKNHADGYRDGVLKEIGICDLHIFPGFEDETDEHIAAQQKETMRHEITHAFLYESGLDASSVPIDSSWATNEEMVDWFAIQGPKIYKAWQEVGAL